MTDKIKNIVLTITFCLILVAVMVINIIDKDKSISLTERRKYQAFPEFSFERLFKGTFTSQFDTYTMDQFIQRDKLRKLKALTELYVFRKKDVNQIYEYNGYLLKQEYPLNEKSITNICKRINWIKDNYLNETNNVFYSIIPDKNCYVDGEYLKLDYEKIEEMMSDNLDIEYIRIIDSLKLEDYYYTDTHWKQENLEKILDIFADRMKFKDRIKTSFEKEELGEFKGVYTGQLQVNAKEDTIYTLTNDIIKEATVENFETGKTTSIYDLDKLKGLDKYDVFLSGATPLITITNPKAETEKELVIFRDSFGSSITPLFTEGYSKIIVVDTRYISSQYVQQLVNFENKDVLFLYSTLIINSSSALK